MKSKNYIVPLEYINEWGNLIISDEKDILLVCLIYHYLKKHINDKISPQIRELFEEHLLIDAFTYNVFKSALDVSADYPLEFFSSNNFLVKVTSPHMEMSISDNSSNLTKRSEITLRSTINPYYFLGQNNLSHKKRFENDVKKQFMNEVFSIQDSISNDILKNPDPLFDEHVTIDFKAPKQFQLDYSLLRTILYSKELSNTIGILVAHELKIKHTTDSFFPLYVYIQKKLCYLKEIRENEQQTKDEIQNDSNKAISEIRKGRDYDIFISSEKRNDYRILEDDLRGFHEFYSIFFTPKSLELIQPLQYYSEIPKDLCLHEDYMSTTENTLIEFYKELLIFTIYDDHHPLLSTIRTEQESFEDILSNYLSPGAAALFLKHIRLEEVYIERKKKSGKRVYKKQPYPFYENRVYSICQCLDSLSNEHEAGKILLCQKKDCNNLFFRPAHKGNMRYCSRCESGKQTRKNKLLITDIEIPISETQKYKMNIRLQDSVSTQVPCAELVKKETLENFKDDPDNKAAQKLYTLRQDTKKAIERIITNFSRYYTDCSDNKQETLWTVFKSEFLNNTDTTSQTEKQIKQFISIIKNKEWKILTTQNGKKTLRVIDIESICADIFKLLAYCKLYKQIKRGNLSTEASINCKTAYIRKCKAYIAHYGRSSDAKERNSSKQKASASNTTFSAEFEIPSFPNYIAKLSEDYSKYTLNSTVELPPITQPNGFSFYEKDTLTLREILFDDNTNELLQKWKK